MMKQWFVSAIVSRVISRLISVATCCRRALFPLQRQTLSVFLVAGLATTLTAGVASAAITGYTGDIELVDPPSSVQLGAFESSENLRVFTERENVTLATDVAVNVFRSGGKIPAGTRVNSYFVHFDPVGGSISAFFRGTLTFEPTSWA
jgi:hypothetical protein